MGSDAAVHLPLVRVNGVRDQTGAASPRTGRFDMQTLRFSIEIDAPRETVWDVMLSDATYREWTAEFVAGSHYVGDWDEGSRILFLGPGENGESGMVSRIRTNRRHEHISIEHVGMVENGREDTTSEAVKDWAGALENYTFRDANGGTEVLVEMDTTEEHRAMFEETWPRALSRLKALAEGAAHDPTPRSDRS